MLLRTRVLNEVAPYGLAHQRSGFDCRCSLASHSESARNLQQIFDELLSASHSQYISPVHLAMICAGLGNHEAALEWLEKAYDRGDSALSGVMIDPQFQPLRTNPRFKRLQERMGLAAAKQRSRSVNGINS